jgi:two-component system, LytTR family, sensor kinase
LKAGPEAISGEDQYVEWVRAQLASFFSASPTGELTAGLTAELNLVAPGLATLASGLPEVREPLEQLGVEAIVPLRVAGGERHYYVLLGRRQGGRPYLSEDLEALTLLASEASEQLESYRDAQQRKLITEAELRALQSQIHPHFLFNALNTLYGVIPREAAGARRTVLNLADIFRYFLRGERSFIALEEEVTIIKAYLEIESLRLGDKLQSEITIQPEALAVRIPILSIQPLVENAVKHGVATQPKGGKVRLLATVTGDVLTVLVEDSGPGFTSKSTAQGAGLGLENVRRRLELCYGNGSRLTVHQAEQGPQVSFQIPIGGPASEVVR